MKTLWNFFGNLALSEIYFLGWNMMDFKIMILGKDNYNLFGVI